MTANKDWLNNDRKPPGIHSAHWPRKKNIVLALDGSSEHVAHVCQINFFFRLKIMYSLPRAQGDLCYNLIKVLWFNHT